MAEVKLFGSWSSPFLSRVEIGLKKKGVEYEYIEEDLKNKSPDLLKYNPVHKKIPVLLHNGNPVAESLIVLEYIDEVWEGPSILPKDPYEKAMARFWAKYIDETCMPIFWKACMSKGEEQERSKGEATEALKFLDNEIKGKKFFGGDNIGLVDIAATFIAYWFRIVQEVLELQILTEDKFPNLWKWADEYCSNSFVKENLPDKDKLTDKLAARFKAIEAGNQ